MWIQIPPVQNNRDKGSYNTDADQGSATRVTLQKDTNSSIGDPFRNMKRHGSTNQDEPPLKMSREILHQVDDDLGVQEAKSPAADELLAEKINHAYFESSADYTKLQKNNERKSIPKQPYGGKALKTKL